MHTLTEQNDVLQTETISKMFDIKSHRLWNYQLNF